VNDTAETERSAQAAMFQADFGETVQKICEAVRDVYGDGGARLLADAIDKALRTQ
jgi:hypothetical protein